MKTSFRNKLLLTGHVATSVSWLGAVMVFAALAVTGLNTNDMQVARSAYVAMDISAWAIILPLSILSLVTGVVQALITKWGLFRYYWVVVKLFLTIVATVLLLLHLQPIRLLSGLASGGNINSSHAALQVQMIADAGAAILLLIGIITISVYKPWGKISDGRTQTNSNRNEQAGVKLEKKHWLLLLLFLFVIFVIVKHLFGNEH